MAKSRRGACSSGRSRKLVCLAAAALLALLWPLLLGSSPALAGELPFSVFHHTARLSNALTPFQRCWRTSQPDALLGTSAVLWRASPDLWSTRWGNALSVYWQARGVALLGGLSFEAARGGGFASSSWMGNLPDSVRAAPASAERRAALIASCSACASVEQYPHECATPAFAHRSLVAVARRDAGAAMAKWRELHYRSAATATRSSARATDHRVAVHVRCCNPRNDPTKCTPGAGWLPWSFYRAALTSLATRPTEVILVAGRQCADPRRATCALGATVGAANCTDALSALQTRLKETRGTLLDPGCLVVQQWETPARDWFTLIEADTLIAGVSTFSFWAAILHEGRRGGAATGDASTAAAVVVPRALVPNLPLFFGAQTPPLHAQLHWIDVKRVVTTRDEMLDV